MLLLLCGMRRHEVSETEICEVSLTKNPREKTSSGGQKIPGKILKKIHPLLLVLFRDQSFHCMSSQVLVKLTDVHERLVGFPAVTGFPESGPSNLEIET